MKVQEQFKEPIKHAIECKDKALLDRIELEIVRELKIKPDESATAHLPEELSTWKAIGITSVGRDLAVLWSTCSEEDCCECDGSGWVTARGNRKSFDVECPECWGSGKQDSGAEYRCWTDIDGAKLETEPTGPMEVEPVIDSSHDPLRMFYESQKNKQKEAA